MTVINLLQTIFQLVTIHAWRTCWRHSLALLMLFGGFILLIRTAPVIEHSLDELTSLDGMRGFYPVERLPDQQDSRLRPLAYSWTAPQSSINLKNLPRYAPLDFIFELSLDRPPGAAPARLEITQEEEGRPGQKVAELQINPEQPGFQRVVVRLPPGIPPDEPGITVGLNSNGFKPGDGRELGVRVAAFEVRTAGSWRELFIWPNPYIPAVCLFALGLLLWSLRVGLDWQETALLAAPLFIAAAESAQYMQARSWWLVVAAVLLAGSAWLYGRRWPKGKQTVNHPAARPGKPAKIWINSEISLILLAVLAASLFFMSSWPAVYDTRYYIDWNRDIQQNGPFGIYNHSPSLNYPPVIVYLLWAYGLVANPLGLGSSYTAVKFFLGLSLPLLVYVVWVFLGRQAGRPERLPAILLMLGISAGAIYNPIIYGQSDAPLGLLLVWSFLLTERGYARRGAMMAALSLLYKLQTVYLAPLLLIIMLKRSGWRRTCLAALPALGVVLLLSLPAFGFNREAFNRYWNQGQLAGDGLLEYGAFNLLDLLDANNGQVNWVVPLGFGIIALVYGGLALSTWQSRAGLRDLTLAAGLAILVCFMFAIKVKQHYLYYPLPFLGLAALYDRRLVKPWLMLGGVYTLMLVISPVISRRGVVYDNFLEWNRLIKAWHPVLEDGLAGAGILLFFYLAAFYTWRWIKGKSESIEKEPKPVSVLD